MPLTLQLVEIHKPQGCEITQNKLDVVYHFGYLRKSEEYLSNVSGFYFII